MTVVQDLKIAARMLAKNKGWTAVALLALALGLGANVAIFSVVGLMIQAPLPFSGASQLVHIPQSNAKKGFSQASVSYRDVLDWQAAEGIASIAAYRSRPMALTGDGEPQYLPAMQVTPEFFQTLGVKPAAGRGFTKGEGPESDARVAVLSHAMWQGLHRGEQGVLWARYPFERAEFHDRRRHAARISLPVQEVRRLAPSCSNRRSAGAAGAAWVQSRG